MINILIYGSRGWIGKQVVKSLNDFDINYIEGKERCDDVQKVEEEIKLHNPSHILCLIGRTHGKIGDKIIPTIDYLEEEGKLVENIRDNLFSPLILSMICKEKNIHFTYLGTGCIFDGESDGYTEEDEPNFFGSSYSIVKGFTDRLMKKQKILNLRIRMPINDEISSRNFITKITTYDKICSIPNSMTVLPELIPYAIEMMLKNITGTINLTNPGVISHNEILEMYKEIVDNTFTWKNFTIEEQNQILSSKRSNNKLNTDTLKIFFPKIKNIKDSVRDCLERYPKPYPKIARNITENVNMLITGGCGFIGSHFVNYIYKKYENIQIINLDAMYYCSDENNVDECIRNSNRYKLLKMNLNDITKELILKYDINYVVHFAAQSHVQNSFYESVQYTYDNVLGTHKLLESCKDNKNIKLFIHVSTDEVYGESKIVDDKKTETSLLCPTNPYAGTKAAAELIVQTYSHSFKLPIIITRSNNVFGKNQYHEKLIPRFIKLLNEDKKVTIQGNGMTYRSFLHVDDVVNAFDTILTKGVVGEIYNIGCDDNMEYSVMEISQILIEKIKKTNNHGEWIEYVEDRPFNDTRYYISNSKLKNLGWKINKNFLDSIDELISIS
jgi:dTDP-glucose 4,6-dehydratase